jgi:hypothetical protein
VVLVRGTGLELEVAAAACLAPGDTITITMTQSVTLMFGMPHRSQSKMEVANNCC